MASNVNMNPERSVDLARTTGSILPTENDPWGIIVVGSQGVAPLCSEAGRLGFELFRCHQLTDDDTDRLHSADWAAAVVINDGSDLSATKEVLRTHLAESVPVVWVGEAPSTYGGDVTRLPQQCPSEQIAATVFDRARSRLYPTDLVLEIRRSFTEVMRGWREPVLHCGPVWIKNHTTPPFSMTAVANVLGDISGELTVSGQEDWFAAQADHLTIDLPDLQDGEVRQPEDVAATVAGRLLASLQAYLIERGADVTSEPPHVLSGGQPIYRRVSHRPALCSEFATESGDLFVVEFSGTGLESLA